MKKILVKLKPFIIVCLLFLSISFFCLSVESKCDLHLAINQTHTLYQDVFFKYFTNIGDGLFAGMLLLVLLFIIKIRNIFIGISTFIISGLGSQFIKKVFFLGTLRPAKVFDSNMLHYVDGVKLNYINTFPSGHAATAFAMFMFLAYIYNKSKMQQVVFAVIACLVAYSRVYLSQHFLMDVACGAILGVVSFLISFLIFNFSKIKWFDYKLSYLFARKRQQKLLLQ